ncbi:cobalamin B12-binding domain-containing protein [Methylobacterium sp. P1-11]|uniref:cobalamin B12-binding domain-containing protein n=1 Tax=Methylobacterium sp. P1-11 TaxID=2024616 RepID=UPI0011EBC75F|nr:cobalamin B12-binding domain-containing protein [Methylobacterium sp. P1-11]KAA0124820.1 cobalamin B12-binding domain-containing protein [Methylobacterium sp. P1-11]
MLDAAGFDGASASLDRRYRPGQATAWRNMAYIHAGLARVIEAEILPRLVLAHQEGRRAPASEAPSPERVVAFAQALIGSDPDGEWVRALLEEDLTLEALLLDLFAPAARHLGRLWEEDEANFLDVAVALGRLQSLTRVLCTRLEGVDVPANGRRVLLMPSPGETHLFSLALVASFFREAGWSVVLSSGEDCDPAALVQTERFDLIGISLSCDALLPALTDLVGKLRVASCNAGVRVMVGGPKFLREPACATAVGADAVAEDGRSAVKIAEALFAR